jgi:hypothetical protein
MELSINPQRLPLTKLALYLLSLDLKQRREQRLELAGWLAKSAAMILKRTPLQLGKVAAVLDCSYSSSSGSREKRRRPLGIALAAIPVNENVITGILRHCKACCVTTPAFFIAFEGDDHTKLGGSKEILV